MKVDHKSFMILTLILLIFFIIIGVISFFIFPSSFFSLEDREVRIDNTRVMHAFDYELSYINWTTKDWASWDDTYDYLLGIHPQFIGADLTNEILMSMRINDFIVLYSNGTVFLTKSVDLLNKKEVQVNPNLIRALKENNLLNKAIHNNEPLSGYLPLPEGLVLISSFPIKRSDGSGPAFGSLVLSKNIDENLLNYIKNTTKVSFQILKYNNTPLFDNFLKNSKNVQIGQGIIIRENPDYLSLYTQLQDLKGGKNFVVQVKKDRVVANESLKMVIILLFIVLLTISALITLFLLLFYILVYRPISLLNVEIRRISAMYSFQERVSVKGKDEIASLAYSFNKLLTEIENKEKALNSETEMYRLFAERIDDGIILAGPDYSIRYANARASVLLSDYGDLLNWFDIRNFFAKEFQKNITGLIEETQKTGLKRTISLSFEKNNEKLWISISFIPIHDPALIDSTLLIILHDITEQVESGMEVAIKNLEKLEYDMEQFQVLNDSIRNPLSVILGIISLFPTPVSQQMSDDVKIINKLINDIDISWVKSEKLHKSLKEYLKSFKNIEFD